MLKHILAVLALILVSLAPVHAEEGYIPYWPDFLEPDGIGFRGPAENTHIICITSSDVDPCGRSNPAGVPFADQGSPSYSSPITLEFRKNYLFKKLLFTQVFFDFDSFEAIDDLKMHFGIRKKRKVMEIQDIDNNDYPQMSSYLNKFLTAEEKSTLSSLDGSRIFGLKTQMNYILFNFGIGLDLWFFEFSTGAFLMLHDTKTSLMTCKRLEFGYSGSNTYVPAKCDYSDDKRILDQQSYSGLGYGGSSQFSMVFLQTNNWRVSMEFSSLNVHKLYDSNLQPVQYRGLNYYPSFHSFTGLGCSDNIIREPDGSTRNGCINTKGEDMSSSADYTGGLKITYYFR